MLKRNIKKYIASWLAVILMIMNFLPHLHIVNAEGTTTITWPGESSYIAYTDSSGNIIYDPSNEPGISPDDVDFSSGALKGKGDRPSFYVSGDENNLYFRMRLLGDPRDAAKGGYLSSVWLVKIAQNGNHIATVGLNGKSPHKDYVYASNANGSDVREIYSTTSTSVPGTRVTEDTNGDYFLDYQVPIASISDVSNLSITADSVLQFHFASSKSANLSVINKDGEDGGLGSFVKLSPISIYNPAIAFTNLADSYTSAPTTISGTTSKVASGSQVTLTIQTPNNDSETKLISVINNSWSATGFTKILTEGTYVIQARVLNENGQTATIQKNIVLGSSNVTINGPESYSTFTFPSTFTGTYARSGGGKQEIDLLIFESTNLNTAVTSVLNKNANSSPWTNTFIPTEIAKLIPGKTYIIKVRDSNYQTVSDTQTIKYLGGTISITSVEASTSAEIQTPTVVGKASANAKFDLLIDGYFYKEIIADGSGNWTTNLIDRPLTPRSKPYSFQAILKDEEGNSSKNSNSVDYTVNSIDISIENGESVPNEYIYINNLEPTFRGKSTDTNVNLEIKEVGNQSNSFIFPNIPVNAQNKWSFQALKELFVIEDGKHYTVTVTAANDSTKFDTLNIRVKSSTFITITSAAPDTNGSIVGNSEPDAIINLSINKTSIQQVTSDANGDWVSNAITWAQGTHDIIATTSDIVGNTATAQTGFSVGGTVTSVLVDGAQAVTIPDSGSITRGYTSTVKDENDQPMTDTVLWSIEGLDVEGVTIDPTTGVLSVESTATNGATVNVIAESMTNNTISGSKAVTLSRAAQVLTSITIDGATTITIPSTETKIETYNETVLDQTNTPMSDETVTWSISGILPSGVSLDESTGQLTIMNTAKPGTKVTIVATSVTNTHIENSVEVTLTNSPPVVTLISISGADSIIIPGVAENASIETFTTVVTDQYGVSMAGETVTWSLENQPSYVSIDSTGKVSVFEGAAVETIQVKAAIGLISRVKTVELIKANPIVKSITVVGSNTINIPGVKKPTSTKTYTTSVLDQYGVELTNQNIVWSLATTTEGVSINESSGIVSVTDQSSIGNIEVVATLGEIEGKKSVELLREASLVTTLTVIGSDKVIIPGTGQVETQESYTVKVLDQYEIDLEGKSVVWSLVEEKLGVSINPITGIVNVTDGTDVGLIQVQATIDSVSNTKTVNLIKGKSVVTSINVTGENSIFIPGVEESASIETFTTVVTDQYGVPMEEETVTWSLETDKNGVSVNLLTGEVTVTDMAITGDIVIVAVVNGISTIRGTKKITLNARPSASNLAITGALEIGESLSGFYTFSGTNGKPDTSTYKWYIAEDKQGNGKKEITGANRGMYTLLSEDAGKYIIFEVTPSQAEDPNRGKTVTSTIYGPIIAFGDLKGTAFSATGGTITNLQVKIKNKQGALIDTVLTNELGQFAVDQLVTGTYEVMVENSKEILVSKEATITRNNANKTDLVLPTLANIILVADPSRLVGDGSSASTLTASLEYKDQTTIVGVPVRFVATAGRLSKTSETTNNVGKASAVLTSPIIEGVEPKTEQIEVVVHDLESGVFAEKTIEFTFLPASIQGVVTSGGKPVANAEVTISEDFDGDNVIDYEDKVTTEIDGTYNLIVPKGNWTYTLKISAPLQVGGRSVIIHSEQITSIGILDGKGKSINAPKQISGHLFFEGTEAVKTINEVFSDQVTIEGTIFDILGNPLNKTVHIEPDGSYKVDELVIGTYKVLFKFTTKAGEQLAGVKRDFTITSEGEVVIEPWLIDPFGIVTNQQTGQVIAGAEMKLYWADTELNIGKGRIPHTLVDLPILENFSPNENRNPQYTTTAGEYAWMVFANGDYYFSSSKSGYFTFNSRNDVRQVDLDDSWIRDGIIHVGETIVEYDFAMEPIIMVPEVPKNLNAVGVTSSSIELIWDIVRAPVTYKVYRDGELIESNLTEPTFLDKTLVPGKMYSYEVTAVNNMGDSAKSESVSKVTLYDGKEILSYFIQNQVGNSVIDPDLGTITATVENETDLSNLTSSFTLSKEATAKVESTVQVSGTTKNNFNNKVIYNVVAQDGTVKNWTVTINVETLSKVNADIKDALKLLKIRYAVGDIWESTTLPVFLVKDGTHNTVVGWTSSNEEVIKIEKVTHEYQGTGSPREFKAIVNRQDKDVSVILTSTVSKGNGVSLNRTFLLVVKSTGVKESKSTEERKNNVVVVDGQSISAEIQRTKLSDGSKIDKLIINPNDMDNFIQANNGNNHLNLDFSDKENLNQEEKADELAVEIPITSVEKLTNSTGITVRTPEGSVSLSSKSLAQVKDRGSDLFFRIVPIRNMDAQKVIRTEALQDENVKRAAGNANVELLDIPREIETNYTGIDTEVILPLTHLSLPTNPVSLQQYLNSLRVYIQHSDGTKHIVGGTGEDDIPGIIVYSEEGNPIGIKFTISKFSTFTMFQVTDPIVYEQPATNPVNVVSSELILKDQIIKIDLSGSINYFDEKVFSVTVGGAKAEIMNVELVDGKKIVIQLKDSIPGGNQIVITYRAELAQDKNREHSLPAMLHKIQNSDIHYKYMNGYPDKEFKPANNVTRAEVSGMLARLLNRGNEKTAPTIYKDIPATNWAAGYIEVMRSTNIMLGYEEGRFRPNQPITRGEIATVILRFLKNGSNKDQERRNYSFPDIKDHWARNDIEKLKELGIMEGENGLFYPNKYLTRAEAVCVINRALNRGILTGEFTPKWKDVDSNHWAYRHIVEASRNHESTRINETEELLIRFMD